jgi:hypothetical protein
MGSAVYGEYSVWRVQCMVSTVYGEYSTVVRPLPIDVLIDYRYNSSPIDVLIDYRYNSLPINVLAALTVLRRLRF